MKCKRKIFGVVLFATTITLCLAGCDKDETIDANPRVVLKAGEPSSSSITFTATPTDADRCAFACVKEGEKEPAADEILRGGEF